MMQLAAANAITTTTPRPETSKAEPANTTFLRQLSAQVFNWNLDTELLGFRAAAGGHCRLQVRFGISI